MAMKQGEVVGLDRHMVPAPVARSGSRSFLASLDLPGRILDTISEILEYKKEVKRLELEALRIDREADLRHRQIDARLSLALEELGQRSQRLRELLAVSSSDLDRTSIDRRKIGNAIARLAVSIAAPGGSLEDRELAQGVLAELVKLQMEQMQHARATLDCMASVTRAVLNRSSILHRAALPLVEE